MNQIKFAKRFEELPTYIFSEINAIKERVKAQGMDLLSLAIGDPDRPTPPEIVNAMQEAISQAANHQYSPYQGTDSIRKTFSQWLQQRFEVNLDPQKEIIALIGSKEGLAHLPIAICDPGDVALFPSPGFPMYATAISLAGGIATPLELIYDNQFLPDLDQLEHTFKTKRPKFMFLNYPHNPTSAVCPKATLTEIVTLAKKYNVIIAYDNAYSEIYYEPQNRPISIFQIEGAKDIAIEFHSLSKAFNMTGWRIAFAVGNEDLVQALLKVKTNIDSGPLPSVQQAACYALNNAEKLTSEIRSVYKKRLDVLTEGLDQLKIEYFNPPATFFLWAKVPTKQPSMEFVKELIEQKGLVLTPGIGFGAPGEGFFRIAMTVELPKLNDALNRLESYLKI